MFKLLKPFPNYKLFYKKMTNHMEDVLQTLDEDRQQN